MTICKRSLCLSLVFVCLFVLCSNSFYAHADSGYFVGAQNYRSRYDGSQTANVSHQKFDLSEPSPSNTFEVPLTYIKSPDWFFTDKYDLSKTDGSLIVKKGEGFTFSISEVLTKLQLYEGDTHKHSLYFKPSEVESVKVQIRDMQDNILEVKEYYYEDAIKYLGSPNYSYAVKIHWDTPVPEDVHYISVRIAYRYDTAYSNGGKTILDYPNTTSVKRTGLTHEGSIYTFEIIDESVGLLNGIIAIVTNIKDGIGNIFDAVSSGFGSIVNSISSFVSTVVDGFGNVVDTLVDWFGSVVNTLIELPSKLWALIEKGLKALFIPDSYFIEEYKRLYETLLSSRFGAIYQSADILIDYFTTIINFDESSRNSIVMPETTINVAGEEFTFGGWDIKLVPQGFEFLVDAVKFVIDVCVSLLFINAMRKRYDELVGGV